MMKITQDENGKYIVDFQGLRVDIRVNAEAFPLRKLFNNDVVSMVKNGNFRFTPAAEIPVGVEGI